MNESAGAAQTEAISLTLDELATPCLNYACDALTIMYNGTRIETLLKREDSLLSQVDVPPDVLEMSESCHQEMLDRMNTLRAESEKNLEQLLALVASKV